ncbi:MAG: outer membrane beta-barrel protein, partial [Cytophagaceae bacterium]
KISAGGSRLGSSHLKTNLRNLQHFSPLLVESGSSSGVGSNLAVGLFYEKTISDVFAIYTDPSVCFSRSNIYITKVERHMYENEDYQFGYNHRISSKASFRFGYLSIPLLAKYTFAYNQGYYVLGGFAANFVFKGRLFSDEEVVMASYAYSEVDHTEADRVKNNAKIDHFSPIRFDFIIGVGRLVRFLRRDMFMELRYNLPFTRTNLYTSDSDFFENTFNNNIFSKDGQEISNLGRPIRNFNLSSVNFSIRYTLKRFNH